MLGECTRVVRLRVVGVRSDLPVSRCGDAETGRHREPRSDELAEIRRFATHHGQQLRIKTAEVKDEFLVD
jgi:hypothetical protein